MLNKFLRGISLLLTAVLLVNMLPLSIFAQEYLFRDKGTVLFSPFSR